ncbi:Casparian strip membrane protein 3 [Sesamum alatum]|uniref:CASP-like protein n=1 Tax=Sesamum alatum TaxID=300844 RepID=A0AAE1YH91_9LAMI|nr:Casparian strip membrane protein 3 [Sesamum alatum]
MKPDGAVDQESKELGVMRGVSILELVLRVVAILGTLASAVAMGTTDETLPFSTQTVLFQAQYDDIPTFRFFVITNALVCRYLAISLPMAVYHVIRTGAAKSRALLIFLDATMLSILTAAASAAAAIVYLAHKGNASANWLAICQQYQNFCERITGSLIGSFVAVLSFVLLIPLSGLILTRQRFLPRVLV